MQFNWTLIPGETGWGPAPRRLDLEVRLEARSPLALSAKKTTNFNGSGSTRSRVLPRRVARRLRMAPRVQGRRQARRCRRCLFFLVAGVSLVWSKRDVMDLAAALVGARRSPAMSAAYAEADARFKTYGEAEDKHNLTVSGWSAWQTLRFRVFPGIIGLDALPSPAGEGASRRPASTRGRSAALGTLLSRGRASSSSKRSRRPGGT